MEYKDALNKKKFQGKDEAIEYLQMDKEKVDFIVDNMKDLEKKYDYKPPQEKAGPTQIPTKQTGRTGAQITGNGATKKKIIM
jgi:hypothetical protein